MSKVPAKHYVKNADILKEIYTFKETCKYNEKGKYIKDSGRIHHELGRMIMIISKGLCSKGNYSGYTWTDDMIAEGILTVCKYLHNFDPEKSNNPFAYITQICNNTFKSYIKGQKRHSVIKNTLYQEHNMNCHTQQFKEE